jgi:hypothetical protein
MYTKEYQCPACGGAVRLDIASQKLRCFFCAVEYETEALEESGKNVAAAPAVDDALFDVAVPANGASGEELFDAEIFDATVSAAGDDDLFDVAVSAPVPAPAGESGGLVFTGNVWENPEADGVVTGGCPSCGAGLFGGKTALAATCPCCGSAGVVQKRFPGLLKPDRVIPFKYDKSDAAAALAEFCEGKRLLPDSFRPDDRADEFQGVYAPFWLVDALAEVDVWYDAVTRYKGRMVLEDDDWHDIFTDVRPVTRYGHDSVKRVGGAAFENIPVYGSDKIDDACMYAIEPFDVKELEEFAPSRLAGGGHTAVMCDADANACALRAKMRMGDTVAEELKTSVHGYDWVTAEISKTSIKSGRAIQCLFPLWTLNAEYSGENYLVMMNGQTGKVVGKLPVDEGKVWKYRALFTAAFSPVAAMLLHIADRYLNTGLFLMMSLPVWFIVILSPFIELPGKPPFDGESGGIVVKIIGSLFAIMCAFVAIATVRPPIAAVLIIVVSVIFSAFTGFMIVKKWKAGMDTVKPNTEANDYMVSGSLVHGVVKP